MGQGDARFELSAALIGCMLFACGGVTVERSDGNGGSPSSTGGAGNGSGGSPSSTGGAGNGSGGKNGSAGAKPSAGGATAVLPDCAVPLASGVMCSQASAHCGGPCSNSWQTDYVCKGGTWMYDHVVACGPNASHPPQCRNAFGGNQLTPCCEPAGLDCNGRPDGYPGFGCTPGEGSFCSCTCASGMSVCGC